MICKVICTLSFGDDYVGHCAAPPVVKLPVVRRVVDDSGIF